jgi:hypothetical protein
MKYAIVKNNTVVNVAVAEHPLADNWVASETAAIGDTFDGEMFVKPIPILSIESIISGIKDEYATKAMEPVEVDGILWTGGDSSASAINGAIMLAQVAGESDVTLWDYHNINHPGISFEQAQNIAAQIAIAYRTTMHERNEKIAEAIGGA